MFKWASECLSETFDYPWLLIYSGLNPILIRQFHLTGNTIIWCAGQSKERLLSNITPGFLTLLNISFTTLTMYHKNLFTERITCILCMHLGACRFFTHPTALMHLKKWILRKCIQLHFIFLAHTRIGSHWELL